MCSRILPINAVCAIQIAAWIFAGLLLLHGGSTYLFSSPSAGHNVTAMENTVVPGHVPPNFFNGDELEGRLFGVSSHEVSGVIMIIFGISMLLAVPLIIVVRSVHKRRKLYLGREVLKPDLPPRYEDVVEPAPLYSSLMMPENSQV